MSGIRLAVHRSPLAALNGENSRAKVQNVREDSSAMVLVAVLVRALRNGLITVNPEAQRSLAKGASKENTRELIDSDRVHSTTRMREIIKFFHRVMTNVENGNSTDGFFGAIQLVVPEGFHQARIHELHVTGPEKAGNFSLGSLIEALSPGGLRLGTLTMDADLGAPALHLGDGQGRLVGLHSMERTGSETDRGTEGPDPQGGENPAADGRVEGRT